MIQQDCQAPGWLLLLLILWMHASRDLEAAY
jgi:hypothetical protein